MQLPDGDKSLHQLRKGGGEGAPALYGFIQLVHLDGQDSGQPSAKYTPFTRVGKVNLVGQEGSTAFSLLLRAYEDRDLRIQCSHALLFTTRRVHKGAGKGMKMEERELPDLALGICIPYRSFMLGNLVHFSQDTLKAQVLRLIGHLGLPESQATCNPICPPLNTCSRASTWSRTARSRVLTFACNSSTVSWGWELGQAS